MSSPLYLCLRIAEFAAQALTRLRPECRKSAVVIVQGDAPLETICALNRLATTAGVRHEMTRAELESFPQVMILRRSTAEEASARLALLEMAGTFTPRVEEQHESTAFALLLDMTGTQRMFGSPAAMARRVAQCVRQMGFGVWVGVSVNPMCALCVTRSAKGTLQIVPPGHEAEYLALLPIEIFSLSAEQAHTLNLWGLRNAGELANLPEAEVVSRMGEAGKRLRLLARGEQPHFMVPLQPELRLSEHAEFDSPVELLDSLMFVLSSMLAQLVMQAQNHALALAAVAIRLGLEGGGQHKRRIRPALPSSDRYVLLKLIQLDLQANPPPEAVIMVDMTAKWGRRSKVQTGLFSPVSPEPMRLDITLARLTGLLGEGRVGRARLMNRHRPDSFAMERFAVYTPAVTELPQRRAAAICLRQLRPPQSVQVYSRDKRLEALHLRGVLYQVQKAFGPWRRSGEWWSQDVWSCEEWDVAAQTLTGDKLICLLTHDLHRCEWKIVAFYD